MRREKRKSGSKNERRPTKSVNKFDVCVQQFEGALSAEFDRFKKTNPNLRSAALEQWVVRKLAGLSALYIRQAQKRVRRVS